MIGVLTQKKPFSSKNRWIARATEWLTPTWQAGFAQDPTASRRRLRGTKV
jgi:hypothetical protein